MYVCIPRISSLNFRKDVSIRLGYVTDMQWPRRPVKTPYKDKARLDVPNMMLSNLVMLPGDHFLAHAETGNDIEKTNYSSVQ